MSNKYLAIVESPSKCDKIEKYLNENEKTSGATVIATRGHLYKIKSLKDINIKKGVFDIKYTILEEKIKYIKEINNKIKNGNYKKIMILSDDDREGEFIAWSICDIFKLPIDTTERVIFHEITKDVIINSVLNPTKINMSLVQAQQTRTVLDILIGYKISPILWRYMLKPNDIKNETFSAGRCQTPALRLIYDIDMLCKSEELRYEYVTSSEFENIPLLFKLNPSDFKEEDEIKEFIKLETDDKNIHNLTIDEPYIKIYESPNALNTSLLLQKALQLLKMSPKQTMNIAQQLYQEGHITYMRTDSTVLSENFKEQVIKYIKNNYGNEYIKENNINNNKVSPHEGIRCTNIYTMGKINDVIDGKNRLYNLIWKHSLYSCMSNMRSKIIKMYVNTYKPDIYKWETQIEIPLFNGWRILDKDINDIKKEEEYDKYKNYKELKINKIEIMNIIKNKKNNYYTESGLIKKLENIGIGRPSTFHTIVETIKERGYVKKEDIEGIKYNSTTYVYDKSKIKKINIEKKTNEEKGKLVITDIGLKTIEFLIKYFNSLFEYNYTSKMEELLDKISMDYKKEYEINKIIMYNDCLKEIKKCIKNINIHPLTFKDKDNIYEIYYSMKGPLIRNVKTKEIYNIKNDVNIEEINKDNILLKDIIDDPLLGYYKDVEIIKKMGRYGKYIEYGDKRISIKDNENIKIEDIIKILESSNEKELSNDKNDFGIIKNKKILRIINKDISIRKGKYENPYVYYKIEGMKKPEFISLKGKKDWWKTCSNDEFMKWLNEKGKDI